jgi:Flp pilus assembly protein TadD
LDYDKALEIDPNNAMVYSNRGGAKFVLDDKKGACSDWNKAGELGFLEAYDWIKEHCK